MGEVENVQDEVRMLPMVVQKISAKFFLNNYVHNVAVALASPPKNEGFAEPLTCPF